jgi:hypothetical protein
MLYPRWRQVLRGRLAGVGFKQPYAASFGNDAVVNDTVKRRDQTRHVWIRETNASEPLKTHRNSIDDIKTGDALHSQDQHGGNLLIGHVVSGVQVA